MKNKYWVYYQIAEINPRFVLSGPYPTWDAANKYKENSTPKIKNMIPPMILKECASENEYGCPKYPWPTEQEIHNHD